MSLARVIGFVAAHELLERVFADCLEHPEALVRVAEQALLDERLQPVEVGAGDLLGGPERAAAAEDREPREEPLLSTSSNS